MEPVAAAMIALAPFAGIVFAVAWGMEEPERFPRRFLRIRHARKHFTRWRRDTAEQATGQGRHGALELYTRASTRYRQDDLRQPNP